MEDLRVGYGLNCDLEWLFEYNRFHFDVSCSCLMLNAWSGVLSFDFHRLSREEAAKSGDSWADMGSFPRQTSPTTHPEVSACPPLLDRSKAPIYIGINFVEGSWN
jgi:hypothetical protein